MKCVLDSSVAFKWLVAEQDTAKALSLRDDFCKGIIELIAPDFFPCEAVHSLTRAERQGRITQQEGAKLFVDIMATLPGLISSLPLLARAYAISSSERIGVYDCVYVALAERENCDFVTADTRLIAKLQPQYPFIKDLATYP
jgi:predicted nucleic acid-binding protein